MTITRAATIAHLNWETLRWWSEIGIVLARPKPKMRVEITRPNAPPPTAHKVRVRLARLAIHQNHAAVSKANSQGAPSVSMLKSYSKSEPNSLTEFKQGGAIKLTWLSGSAPR